MVTDQIVANSTSHNDSYSSALTDERITGNNQATTAGQETGSTAGPSDFDTFVFAAGLLLVLVVAGTLYASLGLSWEKFSRAEVFFAECAREMLRDKDYVTPLYHGQAFFDKPILVYWFILAMFKTCGVSHIAARIPSITAALSTIALTAMAAARLFNRRSGLIAAMALASSFMFIGFAYLCMSDMTLVMFDLSTMSLLYLGSVHESRRNQLWWFASISIGLAFLTKGPVGVVLPVIAFLAYMAITKQLRAIKLQHVLLGGLTMTIISLPWWIAAYRANGAGALIYFFVRENLIRYTGSTYDTHKPIWFMLTSLLTGFAPWSVFLPFALAGSIKKWRAHGLTEPGSRIELFLWLWVAVVTGFFSLSRGKCDYYVLPVYPATALLTGMYLDQWIRSSRPPARIIAWIFAVAYLVTGVGAAFILQNMSRDLTAAQWLLMPVVLAGSACGIIICLKTKRLYRAYVMVFVGLCLAATCFATQVIPSLVRLIPIGHITATLNKLPGGEKLAVHESLLSWIDEITFQTNREPVKLSKSDEIEAFLSGPQPALLLAGKDKLDSLPEATRARLKILDSCIGITHTLTPGYAIKCKGNLTDPVPVVLVTNKK